MTPTNDRKSGERYGAFMVMAVVIAVGILLLGLLRLVDKRTPQPGDIIAFPAKRVSSLITPSFAAKRAIAPDSMSCILDVQTIQKSGGSLVVETSQLNPGTFRVHWAGVRTSNNHDDCGRSADLVLNGNQIAVLIFAAGGIGVKAQN